MEEDIKVLENMRDNIYGAIQFEDDYQVRIAEQKEFDALNLAINHLRKTKLVHSQFIPKSKLKEKIKEYNIPIFDVLDKLPIMPRTIERGCGAKDGIIYVLQELLEEGE